MGSEKSKTCPKTGAACSGQCSKNSDKSNNTIFQMGNWYRPESLDQLMQLLKSFESKLKYRLVAGNTGTGTKICKIALIYFNLRLIDVYRSL